MGSPGRHAPTDFTTPVSLGGYRDRRIVAGLLNIRAAWKRSSATAGTRWGRDEITESLREVNSSANAGGGDVPAAAAKASKYKDIAKRKVESLSRAGTPAQRFEDWRVET